MKGKISFIDYRILDISFKLNTDLKENKPLEIDLALSHSKLIDGNTMNVGLGLNIFQNAKTNDYPFEMKVVLEGVFVKEDDSVELEHFLPNALAIMFPYARAIVSNFTANANVTPLILPTINIMEYLKGNN